VTFAAEGLDVSPCKVFEVRDDDALDAAWLEHAMDLSHEAGRSLAIDVLEHVRVVDDVRGRVMGRDPLPEIVDDDVRRQCTDLPGAISRQPGEMELP